jgi:uncharacterized protein (TIGR02996 family)
MHPDSESLVRACLDAPADDAPKLVYADWLAERGAGEIAACLDYFVATFAFNGYRVRHGPPPLPGEVSLFPEPPPLPGSTCAVPPPLPSERTRAVLSALTPTQGV